MFVQGKETGQTLQGSKQGVTASGHQGRSVRQRKQKQALKKKKKEENNTEVFGAETNHPHTSKSHYSTGYQFIFSTLSLNHQVKEKLYSVCFRKAIILNVTCEYH